MITTVLAKKFFRPIASGSKAASCSYILHRKKRLKKHYVLTPDIPPLTPVMLGLTNKAKG
jgi:hypothetical protein